MMLYFRNEEFQCSCCHKEDMDLAFLDKLDKLRGKCGHSLVVTSGFRCPKHNKEVGGVKDSMHLQGKAADISTRNMSAGQRHQFINYAIEQFNGIGIAKDFIHLDVRDVQAMWVY